jgi:glycosyltransferase involved in cell wall biosynthesis
VRVAVVTNAYHPFIGGVETHARELCRGLAAAGDSVEVLTQDRTAGVDEVDGVVVRRFPLTVAAADYRFSTGLWRHLARHAGRYDVLHAHSYHAVAALGAALTNRAPLVFTPHYHGTGHSRLRAGLHRVYRPAGRRLLARAARVICVSGAERDLLLRDFPAVAGRVEVVPNGVDPARWYSARQVGGPGRTVLAVGRVEAYKGLDHVIRALPRLPADIGLTVVGTGPAIPALTALAGALGVAGRVSFAGRLDAADLADRVVSAAAVVSASAHEAFGLCAADAMTAGVPVVASDIPAHREVVALAGPYVWSRLVDPADTAALADGLAAAVASARRPVGATSLPTWPRVVAHTRRIHAAAAAVDQPVDRLPTTAGATRR